MLLHMAYSQDSHIDRIESVVGESIDLLEPVDRFHFKANGGQKPSSETKYEELKGPNCSYAKMVNVI